MSRQKQGNRLHPALLLDEMHSPAVARALRDLAHDVLAISESAEMRSMTDQEVFTWAARHERTIVTENVKDFRMILLGGEEAGGPVAGLLFTSSRSFPRSRLNPGPLIAALAGWIRTSQSHASPEDWLRPATPG